MKYSSGDDFSKRGGGAGPGGCTHYDKGGLTDTGGGQWNSITSQTHSFKGCND